MRRMERARGVALETLIQHVPAGQLQELLVKKLNKTKVGPHELACLCWPLQMVAWQLLVP